MRRAVVLGLCVLLAAPGGLRAQDDEWDIRRDDAPRERPSGGRGGRGGRGGGGGRRHVEEPATAEPADGAALRERYLRIVLADPRDGFAMDRLLALYRERDGSLDGLRTEMRERLATTPGDRAVSLVLGRIAREGGALDEARTLYAEVAGDRDHDALVQRALAAVDLAAGDRDAARTHLEAALAASSAEDRDEVGRALAAVLFDLEAWDAVETLYGDLAAGSRGVYLRTELARELAARGEHERAIGALERVEASLSGDRRALAPVLVLQARSEIALGRTEAAITTLGRARASSTATSGVRGEIAELLLEAYRRADRLADLVTELGSGGSSFTERMTLARALDELGRDDEAAEAYGRAAALAARDPEPRTRRMRVLMRAGRIEDAIEVGSSLVRSFPSDPRYVTELAELASSAGRRDEGLEILASASRRAPREVALHRALAELYARWEEPTRAEDELETLVRLEPDDPMHLVALGDHRLSEGDRPGALEAFRAVLESVPDAAAAHALLGGIYADHDMLEAAITELVEATRLAPTSLEHQRELARALERAGEDTRAEAAWSRVLELATSDPMAAREGREHVVALWSRDRRGAGHLSDLRERFEASPPDVEAGRFLAEILRRRSDVEGAIEVLQRVVDLEPADVGSLLLLERLVVQAGDRGAAIDVLVRLAEADRDHAAQYYLRMSEHASALYRDDEALAFARRATELAPDGAPGFARVAALARRSGATAEARLALRRAHELDPRNDDVSLSLAELEGEAGDTTRALDVLRDVVRESPDDESLARAIRASAALGPGAEAPLRDAILSAALDEPGRVALRRLVVDAWSRATASLRAAALADRATEEERAELRRWVTRALGPILGALGGSDAERRSALALLGPASVPAATPALLALAVSEAPLDVRHEALTGAARAPRVEDLERFAALATDDHDLTLRLAALVALGRLGARAETTLRPYLASPEPGVRAVAALGLGRAASSLTERSRTAIAADLEARLADERQSGTAACFAWALSRLAPHRVASYVAAPERLLALDSSSRGVFAAALAGTDDPVARTALALHLARGTERASLALALRRPDGDPLAATMRRGESPAAFALRSLSLAPPAALDLSALETDLTRSFARALEGSEADAAIALAAFEATRTGWSFPSARAAGEVAAPAVPSSLVLALLPAVLRWAERGTGSLEEDALSLAAASGDPSADALLGATLADGSPALARVVLGAVVVRPGPLATAVADALLRHADWGVRALAAQALAGATDETAIAALTQALVSDGYAVVRDAALAALEGSTASGVLEALCEAADHDEEPSVRARALASLGGRECPIRVR